MLDQAYQRLCDWRHNIGSTALMIIMSLLQCASSEWEIQDMADKLLESFSFLYQDLNADSPNKVFCSNLIF